ncbi:uncharacterized protein LOC131884431 isoform X1 [Tigriopus californicus]|uniref:uncharacterized protein LOC131884431 isoform X1 n=1 Tax=Tigriopus californicus TaxID=6832 RepID=UPI0027DA1A59|nr:uncharacterized protein LOC131884431 isoform X1 [Tigriopus californicus]
MTGDSSLKWFLIPVLLLVILSSTRLKALEECTSDLTCRQGRTHEGLIRCIMGQCTWLSKTSEDGDGGHDQDDDDGDVDRDDDASQSQLDSLGTNQGATAVEMIRDLYYDPAPTHSKRRKGATENEVESQEEPTPSQTTESSGSSSSIQHAVHFYEGKRNRLTFQSPSRSESNTSQKVPLFDDFGCDCGESSRVTKRRHHLRFRIVGGKSAKGAIEWVAYIRLVEGSVADFCTGSLINSKYVLSAGHCACMPQIHPDACSTNESGTLTLNYNPTEVDIEVFLNVADRSKIQSLRNGIKVVGVKLHPQYDLSSENPSFDLALFKLERAANANPICLPHTGHFVEPKSATVAGWGFQYKDCQTDFWGPERFATCHTNWKYKGQVYAQCEKTVEPPKHLLCEEFYQGVFNSKIQPVGPVVLRGEKGQIDCPLKRPPGERYHGWCAACSLEQLVGSWLKRGTCIPEPGRKWGFCGKVCRVETLPSRLQKLDLTILEDQECLSLTNLNPTSLTKVNIKVEMCAGKKNYLPHFPIYRRMVNGSKVTFEQELHDEDVLFQTPEYIFGGKDSCYGDSGGPMWIKAKRRGDQTVKVIQIGVVARGEGCAKRGSPGVYTRVKSVIEWIQYEAQDGRCVN